jgi:PRTRC genetic system protein E
MKTNFFRILDRLNPTGDWKINITRKQATMIVSVLLQNGEMGTDIPPMVFSGLPEELDEGFYLAMESPVKETTSLFVNLAEHAHSVEQAKQAIKDKAGTKPAQSGQSMEKKNGYEEALKKVQDLNNLCKYSEALAILPTAEDYPDKKGEIEKLKSELERKNAQLNLL